MRRWFVVAGLAAIAIALGIATSKHERSTAATTPGDGEHRGSVPITAPQRSMMQGHVTSHGAGIPGAIVTIELADARGIDQRPRLVVTDRDGAWNIAVAPDKYIVTASADGFLPIEHDDVEVAAGDRKLLDSDLTAGGTRVHGIVKDIGGGPIAGAHVGADALDGYFGHGQVSTLTRADGSYALTLPLGRFKIEASHDEYVSDSDEVDAAAEAIALDFSLVPGATIRGQVIARDTGQPVPGATVYAGGRRDVSSRSVAADEHGAFVIDRLDSGLVDVFARGGGYSAQVPVRVEVPMGQRVDGVGIVVEHAYAIRGRVVDKLHSDRGVAKATVMLDSGEYMFAPYITAKTSDDGTFELEDVARGDYRVAAYGDDFRTALKFASVRDRDVEVALEANVRPAIVIEGRVIPPAHAKIDLGPEDALAGDGGTFKLEHAHQGKQTLHASTADGRGGDVDVVIGDRNVSGLEVRLTVQPSISGKVVDSHGVPMAGFHVDAMSKGIEMSGTISRADGSFRILGVSPGEVHLVAYRERYPYMADEQHDTKVDVAAGEQVIGVTITVEPRDGIVRGRVESGDGTPVADAWVTAITQTRGVEQHAFTAADGTFTLEHLRAHKYDITAEDSRGARRGVAADVEAGANVTITVAPLATLTVRVTSSGAPTSAYHLRCFGPDMFERDVASPTGETTYDHCRPATYRCTASTDNGVAVGSVEVAAGAARLDLALGPWPTVSGTVVDAAGTPQPGIFIFVGSRARQFDIVEHVTDAHGRFELDRVVPGRGTLILAKDRRFDNIVGDKGYTVSDGHIELGDIVVSDTYRRR